MSTLMAVLRAPLTAYVAMAVLVLCALYFGYQTYGWLGVAMVGVVGLAISLRAELFDAYGDPHERNGGYVVTMYARQLDDRRIENVEQSLKRKAEEASRNVLFRAINSVFTAIAAAGGAMVALH